MLQGEVDKMHTGMGKQALVYNGTALEYGARSWSDEGGARETAVAGALWGVQTDSKPGLEAVLETTALNEKEEQLLGQTESPQRK